MTFQARIVVRFYELDRNGHLNGASYIQLAEHVRWQCCRAAGITAEELRSAGAGPVNLETNRGFAVFHFWYQSAPPDILKLLTSAWPHPFMELGRVAVSACPVTRALASQIKGSRFN